MDEEDGDHTNIDSIYDRLVVADDIGDTLKFFYKLCELLDINPKNHKTVFTTLKSKLKSWKYQNLFNKLEKRSKHVDYKNKPCSKTKVLIIGAGPVGLRLAIECAFLGAHVTVIEKRKGFSRNNVLHLWPFLIVDLKAIGVKSFFGKFCAGSLDHISIKRLQCILLKVSLFLGVQFHTQTLFEDVIQPTDGKGWRAKISPTSSTLNSQEFDVIVGCDGKYNCLKFKRKEFRGKLAIAITCNFVNKQTSEEARVEEISGVAFIYNQDFFHELTQKTGIELENIVYYRDETHYFVMTAKKRSLLSTGVIKQDSKDVFKLLSVDNVNHKSLLTFAREAADFATNYQLPHHQFAVNHYGKEDVAMFDFTSIHQAVNSSRIYERKGKRLLMCIAGDVLLEPFWPTGSGCARGFLGAFDAAWMIRGFGLNRESLDLLQERESIFQLLPQTKPDTLIRKQDLYSIDPATRYLNLNARAIKKEQVSHLLDNSDTAVKLSDWNEKCGGTPQSLTKRQQPQTSNEQRNKKSQIEKEVDPDTLLRWCKEQTKSYPNVNVVNMSKSWQNGLAFCALIHRYRPELIDFYNMNESDAKANCEKAFSIAEEYLGIPPKISARDLVRSRDPDTLTIMAYLSLYYEALKQETPVKSSSPSEKNKTTPTKKDALKAEAEAAPVSPKSPNRERKSKTSKMAIISRLSRRSKKNKLTKKTKEDKENKLMKGNSEVTQTLYEKSPSKDAFSKAEEDLRNHTKPTSLKNQNRAVNAAENGDVNHDEIAQATTGENRYKRISQLAESVFGDKIVQNGKTKETAIQRKESSVEGLTVSEVCHFCNRKVYVVERQSAEGLFFHRSCFRCNVCKCRLLLGNYAYHCDDDVTDGKFYCKVHYNSMIYKHSNEEEEVRENTKKAGKDSTKRRRAVTQQINASHVHAAARKKTIDDINVTPRQPESSQIREIQRRLKQNLPQLEVSVENKKAYLTTSGNGLDIVDKPHPDDEDELENPYDRFTPRSLLDRHPSLLRCTPQKVTTTTFMAASKYSVSTPNLTKLIQEDAMFEEERKKHEDKLNNAQRNLEQDSKRVKKKLSVPDHLKIELDISADTDRHIYGSDDYRQRFESDDVTRTESFGAVQRRPKEERRAQYPVSMAFTESVRTSVFQPMSVDIDIDGDVTKDQQPVAEQGQGKKKKKKLVLKKKKVKKSSEKPDTINEVADDETTDEKKNRTLKRSTEDIVSLAKTSSNSSTGIEKMLNDEEDWVFLEKDCLSKATTVCPISLDDEYSDSTTSDEEDETNSTFLQRTFGGGKKKKKPLTAAEQKLQEQKNKRKDQRKIKKEMKERELKRLWEAQSIQRKLNEVDVKMYELEERAKQVERDLRHKDTSPAETNKLTFEWFNLVNEKNTLLRFESELVIQSNSIQLEDRQARLEQRVRDLLTAETPRTNTKDEVERLTKELVDTVEQRNVLVEMLEEDRLRELEEDKTIEDVFAQKAHAFGMDRLI